MSMTTSFLNSRRYSTARRATRTHASGSSPFTWKIGAAIIRAMSVAYRLERDEDGEALLALVVHVLLGPDDAFENGVDRLEVRGVRGERHGDLRATRGVVGAL